MSINRHYHIRPHGFKSLWVIDCYDGRGGWSASIMPQGMTRKVADKELVRLRKGLRKQRRKYSDALSARRLKNEPQNHRLYSSPQRNRQGI
jgi:hypothetical protein